MDIFRTKSIDMLKKGAEKSNLKKTLGTFDLILLCKNQWSSTRRREDAKDCLVKASGGMVTQMFEHSHLPWITGNISN